MCPNMAACWHLARRVNKNEVRATYFALVCALRMGVPEGKSSFFDAHVMKTREAASDPRWGLRSVTLQTQRCAHTAPCFQPQRCPSHIFSASYILISSLLLYLPQLIHHSSTHTYTQSEAQRPLMSRNVHRSVRQGDSCVCGGSSHCPAVVRSQRRPPIRQWHAWLFPPRVVLILYRKKEKRTTTGQKGAEAGGEELSPPA